MYHSQTIIQNVSLYASIVSLGLILNILNWVRFKCTILFMTSSTSKAYNIVAYLFKFK